MAFSCVQDDKLLWHYRPEPLTERIKLAVHWGAKQNYIHHVECHGGEPIAIVECLRHELPPNLPLRVAPLDPHMWHAHETARQKNAKRERNENGNARPIRTSVAGAVAKAWNIFNENQDLPRRELIAMCIEIGINPGTARAQHFHWSQSIKS